MTDWFETKMARKVGFTARPVVGGVFLDMLYDRAVLTKYAGQDTTKCGGWAPMPKQQILMSVSSRCGRPRASERDGTGNEECDDENVRLWDA